MANTIKILNEEIGMERWELNALKKQFADVKTKEELIRRMEVWVAEAIKIEEAIVTEPHGVSYATWKDLRNHVEKIDKAASILRKHEKFEMNFSNKIVSISDRLRRTVQLTRAIIRKK